MWGSGEEGASITPGGSVCKRALRLLEFMLYTSLSAAQNGSDLGVILETHSALPGQVAPVLS
jgi:hypothetical protein